MFKQISALTAMSLRGIPERPLLALVTVIGVATMVGVVTALLALGAGMTASTAGKIGPNMAVVITRGATSDYMGSIPRDAVSVVADAPEVKKDKQGKAEVLPVIRIAVNVIGMDTKEPTMINLTGTPIDHLESVAGIHLAKGRLYRPGVRELLAGKLVSSIGI
jgi:putative ABC transport system permease protein